MVRFGKKEIPICAAIAGSLLFTALFSSAVLMVQKIESSAAESTLTDQREMLLKSVASAAAEKVAAQLLEEGGLGPSLDESEFDPAVMAVLLTDLTSGRQRFVDFRSDMETNGARAPTILKRLPLGEYGAPGFELSVYAVNSNGRFVEASVNPVLLSIVAVACFAVLIVFYIGYCYGEGRQSPIPLAIAKTGGGKEKRGTANNLGDVSRTAKHFSRVLRLKESVAPFGKVIDSLSAIESFMDRGEFLRAQSEIQAVKVDLVDTCKLISGLTSDSPEQINCSWISMQDVVESVERAVNRQFNSNPSVGTSISYTGNPCLELLSYTDCLPLLIQYGSQLLKRHIKAGFLKMEFFAEKDVVVVRVSISFPCGVPNGAFGEEVQGAIGDGLADILQHIQTLGGSLQVDHLDTDGVGYTLKFAITSRMTGKGAPSVIPMRPTLESDSEGDYKTFYHNFGEGGLKILVVDHCVERMRKTMDHFGYEQLRRDDVRVTFTSDPAEAIRQVEEVRYDCVSIRYGMPSLRALDFLAYLAESEHEYSGAVKVVALSQEDLNPELEAGAKRLGAELAVGDIKLSEIKNTLRKLSLKVV
ncbi:integral membrane sensor hybrid histidine kinase [gamma proteobacterium BDW918]|nr:integral membrane sensor hybrid histidine kinase [gamma proteobacterium BDW918]